MNMTQLIKSLQYMIHQYEKRKDQAQKVAHRYECSEAGEISRAQIEIWEEVLHDLKYTVDTFNSKENEPVSNR